MSDIHVVCKDVECGKLTGFAPGCNEGYEHRQHCEHWTVDPRTYVKKPVEVNAILWTGENSCEVNEFITTPHETYPADGIVIIPTLEGDMLARVGDFIIKGTSGEFYPCKPKIFHEIYSLVFEDVPSRV